MRQPSFPWTVLVVFIAIALAFGTSSWTPNTGLANSSDPPPPQEEVGVPEAFPSAAEVTPESASMENHSDPARDREDTPTFNQEPFIDGIASDRTVGNGCTYPTITAAINASTPGDRLLIEGGRTFNETINVNRNLTLQGGYDGCASGSSDRSTINAGGSGSVVVVNATIEATLTNLNLTGGNTGFEGGGIRVGFGSGTSTVHLDNVHIHNNNGFWGGGVWVGSDSEVIASNIYVYNNTATAYGGGVRLFGGRLSIENSEIHNNTAPLGGGVYGTLEEDTPIPVLDLTSNVKIYDNQALTVDYGLGGGVYLRQGSFTLAGGSAIYSNDAIRGGGIYLDSSNLDASEAFIYGNTATDIGAGIFATASTLSLAQATIGGDLPGEGNILGPDGHLGAGLYLAGATTATLEDSLVSNNSFQTTGYTYGGGAYLAGGSQLTLTRSRFEYHTAPSAFDGRGAGLYVDNSTAILNDSLVDNNTAGTVGGGIRMFGTSTLQMNGDSSISDNSSLNGEGGAIAAAGIPDIDITGGKLVGNTATTHGGAIYIDSGTLNFTGGWTLRENTAGGNGGAVAAVNTATVGFSAGAYSLVYDNRAQGGHGGFLYLDSPTTTRLHATEGYRLYIYANRASDNGGALYAQNNGFFDVYGQVNFDRNRADNGGAIYLSNSSRVWLDDYVNIYPHLWDNFADYGSGGAIYAVNSPSVRCDGAIFGQTDDGNHAAVDGGAIFLEASTFSAENCTFQNNQAAQHGGALAAYNSTLTIKANFLTPESLALERAGTGDGISSLLPAATPRDPSLGPPSRFNANSADSDGDNNGLGGAIYLSNSNLQVDQTVFDSNSAYYGGAIYQNGAACTSEVRNSLIYDNTSIFAYGAGIRVDQGIFTVRHVTLADNIGGAGFSSISAGSSAYNSIAWGNTYGGFWGTFGSSGCNIDQSGTVGLIIDPAFISPGMDYHLLPSSPAIDACADGLLTDLEGQARPVGTRYDIGAYEWINRSPDGYHDGDSGEVRSTGCSAFGWATDRNVPDRDVQVQVLSDSIQVATTIANLYRADLEDECPGGTCAFSVDLWGLISAGVVHDITLQAYDEESDDWWDLEGTPQSLTCWGYPEGHHDGDEGVGEITACRAFGWVGDPDDPTRDVSVQVWVDGNEFETLIAEDHREGIDPEICPDGTCGFELDLWGRIPFGIEHTIAVRAFDVESDEWWELADTPRLLTCLGSVNYLPLLVR